MLQQGKFKKLRLIVIGTTLVASLNCQPTKATTEIRVAPLPQKDQIGLSSIMDFDIRANEIMQQLTVEQFNQLISTEPFWYNQYTEFDLKGYFNQFSLLFSERNIEVKIDSTNGQQSVRFQEAYLLDPDYKSVKIPAIGSIDLAHGLGIRIYGYMDLDQKRSYSRKFYISKEDLSDEVKILDSEVKLTREQLRILPQAITAWMTDPHATKLDLGGKRHTEPNESIVDSFGSYVDILTR